MDIKQFIEMGEKKAGKQIELARILEVRDSTLRQTKCGRNGLPDAVCIQLADYIGVDPLEVIAASNLVTEKDEKRRKIFEKCLKRGNEVATNMILASIVTMGLTMAPVNGSYAGNQGANNLPSINYKKFLGHVPQKCFYREFGKNLLPIDLNLVFYIFLSKTADYDLNHSIQ